MTFSDLIRTEPLRALLTICELGVVLVKLPVWVLFYARRANRPRKSWTLTKTIFVNFLRNVSDPAMRMGRFNGRNSTKESVPKDCQDARFIWLEPVSPKLIDGQVKKFAEAAKVQSARIPAYGYGKWGAEPMELLLAGDNERIVMHLHGGGYIIGTAHPEDLATNISRGLLDRGEGVVSRTLSVDYRLSSSAPYPTSAPFPSAIIDALAGYVYLVQKVGFKPWNIIIAGDSAGGNLALALVRYLRDSPALGLGMPGGLLLFSPWCDPARTHRGAAAQKAFVNARVDYVTPTPDSPGSLGVYILKSFLGDLSREAAAKNPYIGPASLEIEPSVVDGVFAGFPPSYILVGDGEVMIDEIQTLQRRMSADLPEGKLVYDEVEDAVHDFTVFPVWEPERSHAFQRVIEWIRGL